MVEADFAREYALDLSSRLGDISWRRFLVLMRGLGPNSATTQMLQARRYARREPAKGEVRVNRVKGREAALAAFGALWGVKPPSGGEPS